MESRDEFFRLAVIAARLRSETAAKCAVDPLSLQGYGLSPDSMKCFIKAIKPIARDPAFQKYLEGVLIEGYQMLFAMIDGLAAYAADSPHQFSIVDEHGDSLGEGIHSMFEGYLRLNGPVVDEDRLSSHGASSSEPDVTQ